MATTVDLAAFDRGTDPILDFFSVEQARAWWRIAATIR